MSLDVLSPKGQQSVRDESAAAALFEARYPAYRYVETPKHMPAAVDAILLHDGVMRCVVETKCRYDCDLDKFNGQYRSQWLVTFDKVIAAKAVAGSLSLAVVGFLYIVPSKTLLVQQLVDAQGMFTASMQIKATSTQATTNGGKIVRANAYIDMSKALVPQGDFQ